MTNKVKFPCWIIGMMSGTSADGVDAALLYTDGKDIVEIGPSLGISYSDELRGNILKLAQSGGTATTMADALFLKQTSDALTMVHVEAVGKLREKTKEPIGLIGFHGQTIYHDPRRGVTRQIGNAQLLAQKTKIPVIADFRSRDMREGGQGAPLVPVFQQALAKNLPKPLIIVNIGGVANVTYLGANDELIAFDCGPGNALMDDWFFKHTGQRFDEEGRIAARGKVDDKRLREFLSDPFFAAPPPKSLDRNHFKLDLVEGMSLEDGTATLAAMTAIGIAKACELVPESPRDMLVSGGGRHNVTLMTMVRSYTALVLDSGFGNLTMASVTKPREPRVKMTINPIGDVGWDGDMLEAQAFAYLAARSMQSLALSFPTTTGVPRPVTGGVFYPALP